MTEIVLGSKADEKENGLDRLREKYKGEGSTIYEVTSVITEDDDSERAVTYLFKKPTTASYDRYVKTAAASSSRALKTFIQDNIIEEQEDDSERYSGRISSLFNRSGGKASEHAGT